MAFDNLQKLGEEKFSAIVNGLMQGTPAMAMARKVQQDWGDLTTVAEKTLTQQMLRLKRAAAEGMFGDKAKALLKDGGKLDIRMLRGKSLDVLSEMVGLVNVQRSRVEKLLEREQELKMPLTGLNDVINDMKDLLVATQKMQFDLGVDQFKGPIPGMKVTSEQVSRPDGSMGQRTVVEAFAVVDEVFKKRQIPAQVPDGPAH